MEASMYSDVSPWTIAFTGVVGLLILFVYYFVDVRIEKRQRPPPIKLPPDAYPSKSVITCDATSCSRKNPSTRCSKCKMVYYCDQNCQKKHWKEHKDDCQIATQQIYNKFAQEQDTTVSETPKNSTCGICLAESSDIVNPIILKACSHVFCYNCLKQYQYYNQSLHRQTQASPFFKSKTTCPFCRTEMEDVQESIIAKALLFTAQASHKGTSESKKKELCQKALDQMKTLGKPRSDQDILQANIICGHIAMLKGDFKDALAIFEQNHRIWKKVVDRKKKVDSLLKKGSALGSQFGEDEEMDDDTYQAMQQIQNEVMGLMAEGGLGKESDLIDCRLELIQVKQEMGDWENAMVAYQEIMTEYSEQTMLAPAQQRKVLMGFARCLYEMGNYDGSIALGEAAIEMNRHFPGVHKFVALSHKEKGDLEKAQEIMAQAVLYETPWDPVNMAETRKLWLTMMEER